MSKRMMVYEVQLPDGSVAEIEGPEGATTAQLRAAMGAAKGPGLAELTGGLVPDPAAKPIRRSDGPVANFGRGVVHGLEDAGLGLAQFAQEVAPGFALARQMGMPDPLGEFARQRGQANAQTVAGQSTAGGLGRFVGGMVGTAPAAALSLPAKGANLLPSMMRASSGGALASVTATPATTNDYWDEKLPQAAAGAGLGAGVLGLGRGAARLSEEVVNAPRRAVNWHNNKANQSPLATEGEALAQRTDIPLTPGMVSGGRAQTFTENMARQSIFTADKAIDADIRIAEKAIDYVRRVGGKISPAQAGAEQVGVKIQGAVRDAAARTAARREEVASAQYGAIHEALGGRPIVDYSNTVAVLERLANPGGTLSGDALQVAKQASALLKQIETQPARSLKDAIRDRSFWGRGAKGGANVFSDIGAASNRRFAAELYGAIKDDIAAAAAKLDNAGTAGPGIVPYKPNAVLPPGSGLGDALREADKNYRLYSEAISALEASPMARLLGDDIAVGDFLQFNKVPPEQVIGKIKAMAPSEIGMTRRFMEQNAPETWQQYKRLLIDDAIEASTFAPASAGVRRVPMNAAQFVRALGGDKSAGYQKLQAVFGADEMREIDDALEAMRRMGDKFGFNFSNSDVRSEARSVLDAVKSASVTTTASTVGQLSGLQAVARVMLNADGRRTLIELSKLPPTARQAPALIGYLSALAAGQQMPDGQNQGGSADP